MTKERDCQSVFALLSEHLDQELPAESCDELERHIQDCAPCVEFVESLKKSIVLGRGYKPPVEVAPLTPEVKESLKEAYDRMLAARKTGS
jgi:anti-sigma factor RsiW